MPKLRRTDLGRLLTNAEVDENFDSSVCDEGDLPQVTNWNNMDRPIMARVNYADWTGASNYPPSAEPVGLLTVYQSGNAIVQKYVEAVSLAEWTRSKAGVADWSVWIKPGGGAFSIADFLFQNAGVV